MTTLFDPLNAGELPLKQRIVMAPLTQLWHVGRVSAPSFLDGEAEGYTDYPALSE